MKKDEIAVLRKSFEAIKNNGRDLRVGDLSEADTDKLCLMMNKYSKEEITEASRPIVRELNERKNPCIDNKDALLKEMNKLARRG